MKKDKMETHLKKQRGGGCRYKYMYEQICKVQHQIDTLQKGRSVRREERPTQANKKREHSLREPAWLY